MCEKLLLINSQFILECQQSLLWGSLLFELLALGTSCSGVQDGAVEGGAKDDWSVSGLRNTVGGAPVMYFGVGADLGRGGRP